MFLFYQGAESFSCWKMKPTPTRRFPDGTADFHTVLSDQFSLTILSLVSSLCFLMQIEGCLSLHCDSLPLVLPATPPKPAPPGTSTRCCPPGVSARTSHLSTTRSQQGKISHFYTKWSFKSKHESADFDTLQHQELGPPSGSEISLPNPT